MTGAPHPFNRRSFITLHDFRLFTASQVADLIEEYSSTTTGAEQVLDELEHFVRCNLEMVEDDNGDSFTAVTEGDLLNKIAELRSRRGREPG